MVKRANEGFTKLLKYQKISRKKNAKFERHLEYLSQESEPGRKSKFWIENSEFRCMKFYHVLTRKSCFFIYGFIIGFHWRIFIFIIPIGLLALIWRPYKLTRKMHAEYLQSKKPVCSGTISVHRLPILNTDNTRHEMIWDLQMRPE